MPKEPTPYDRLYTGRETTFGGGRPEKLVENILQYRSAGSVLEVGAGEGRNALFLAAHGFQVQAIDTSSVGLEKLRKLLTIRV